MQKRRNRAALGVLAGALLTAGVACTSPPTDIYTPVSPLPNVSPGSVLKQAPFTYKNNASATKATYIQFRSTSATGTPIAVSGTVLVPTAAWTGGGSRPIVGIGPFTLGIADKCAQSKGIAGGDGTVDEALKRGWAVALPDYEGLGTPGIHTYMVGQSQGRTLLDAIRAAQKLPGSGVAPDAPVGIAGYSQGGATAGWAGELAGTYAPELNLKGVVAGGTPSDLALVGETVEGTIWFGLALGAAVGFNEAYPELDLEDYVNDAGRTEFAKADTQCVVDMFLAYGGKRITDYTTRSPLDDPKWIARLEENRLGRRTPTAPTMLWHGSTDQVIPIAQADEVRRAYCSNGVAVQWSTGNTDHVGGLGQFNAAYTPYLADRFAGRPAPSNCGS